MFRGQKIIALCIAMMITASSSFAFEHLKTLKEFEKRIKKGNVIIEFYAPWCEPCKEMKANLKKIDKKRDKIRIYQVNIEKSQDIVDKYGTPQVPAILYIKDGKILQGYIGLKRMKELKSDIKRYFKTKAVKIVSKS